MRSRSTWSPTSASNAKAASCTATRAARVGDVVAVGTGEAATRGEPAIGAAAQRGDSSLLAQAGGGGGRWQRRRHAAQRGAPDPPVASGGYPPPPPLDAVPFHMVLPVAARSGDVDASLGVLQYMVAADVAPTAAASAATRGVTRSLAATVGALDGRARRAVAATAVAVAAMAGGRWGGWRRVQRWPTRERMRGMEMQTNMQIGGGRGVEGRGGWADVLLGLGGLPSCPNYCRWPAGQAQMHFR